jgi:exonuclease III
MDSLGYPYHFSIYDTHWVGQTEKIYTGGGSAIYSKLPFDTMGSKAIVATFENISNHQDYMEKVGFIDIKWQNKPLRIYTARWQSFYLNVYVDSAQKTIAKQLFHSLNYIQEAFPSVEKTHQKEAGIIRNEMNKSPYPFVYCGDMNGLSTSYNCEYLKGKNLQDAFIKGGWSVGATFYKIAPALRIDVCLPDKQFKVLQATVPKRKLSDHYPVIADIKWK